MVECFPKFKEYMALAMERLEERTGPQKEAKTLQKQLEQTKGGKVILWPNLLDKMKNWEMKLKALIN